MIQLGDARVFLEVASSGSFSEAARRLKMPKSSVTRQIERLETTIGGQLLRRTTRTVALTPAGHEFLPHARRLVDDGIEAQNLLRAKTMGASGLLTVSATATIGRRFLVPHLPGFRARHPNVQLAIWLTPARIEVGSGEGQVDVAVRLRASGGPDLVTRKLGEVGFWVVASPGYVAEHGTPSTPDALGDHAMIELGPPSKAHQVELRRGKETVPVRYRPIVQIDDPDAVALAAEAGVGVAVIPSFIAAPAAAAGRLVRLLPGWAPAPSPINLLYRADIAPQTRVRAYVDYLVETIGQSQPWAV